MTKWIYVGLAALCGLAATADYPVLEWVQRHGEFVSDAVTDADGNIFVTGAIRVAPGSGQYPVRNMFVAKFSDAGVLLWETVMEAAPHTFQSTIWGKQIALGTDGSLFATGVLRGRVSATVDGAPFEYAYNENTYLLPTVWKLTDDGDIEWMRAVVLDERNELRYNIDQLPALVAPAPNGGIFFSSVLNGVGDARLEPDGPASFATVQHPPSSPFDPRATFVVRLNTDGALAWGTALQYKECLAQNAGVDRPFGIASTQDGRVCIVGRYAGKIDFDPAPNSEVLLDSDTVDGPSVSSHDWQGFVWMLTGNGALTAAANVGEREDKNLTEWVSAVVALQDGSWAVAARLFNGAPTVEINGGEPQSLSALLADNPTGGAILRFDAAGAYVGGSPTRLGQPQEIFDNYTPENGMRLAVAASGEVYLGDYSADPSLEGEWPGVDGSGIHRTLQKYQGERLSWAFAIHPTSAAFTQVRVFPASALLVTGALGPGIGTNSDPVADFDPFGAGASSTAAGGFIARYLDVITPDVVSTGPSGTAVTNGQSVQFDVTFDEAVTGFGVSDVELVANGSVTGAHVTGVSGSGLAYMVTVDTGSGDGMLRLDVIDDDSVQSATSVPLGGPGLDNGAFDGGTWLTVDKTAPTPAFQTVNSPYTIVPHARLYLTFDEPVTGVTVGSFAVTNGVVTSVTGSGTEWVVDIDIASSGDVMIDFTPNGAVDTAGNGSGAGTVITVTWLDLGEPSVPGPVGWVLALLGIGLLALAWRQAGQIRRA